MDKDQVKGSMLYQLKIELDGHIFDLDFREIKGAMKDKLDAETRDFTINSLYYFYDPKNTSFIVAKPVVTKFKNLTFQALDDLKNNVLRHNNDFDSTYIKDPDRFLRVVRFAVTKGCKIADDDEEFILRKGAENIKIHHGMREFTKIAKSDHYLQCFSTLLKYKLIPCSFTLRSGFDLKKAMEKLRIFESKDPYPIDRIDSILPYTRIGVFILEILLAEKNSSSSNISSKLSTLAKGMMKKGEFRSRFIGLRSGRCSSILDTLIEIYGSKQQVLQIIGKKEEKPTQLADCLSSFFNAEKDTLDKNTEEQEPEMEIIEDDDDLSHTSEAEDEDTARDTTHLHSEFETIPDTQPKSISLFGNTFVQNIDQTLRFNEDGSSDEEEEGEDFFDSSFSEPLDQTNPFYEGLKEEIQNKSESIENSIAGRMFKDGQFQMDPSLKDDIDRWCVDNRMNQGKLFLMILTKKQEKFSFEEFANEGYRGWLEHIGHVFRILIRNRSSQYLFMDSRGLLETFQFLQKLKEFVTVSNQVNHNEAIKIDFVCAILLLGKINREESSSSLSFLTDEKLAGFLYNSIVDQQKFNQLSMLVQDISVKYRSMERASHVDFGSLIENLKLVL